MKPRSVTRVFNPCAQRSNTSGFLYLNRHQHGLQTRVTPNAYAARGNIDKCECVEFQPFHIE
jgi:hypothetical protein